MTKSQIIDAKSVTKKNTTMAIQTKKLQVIEKIADISDDALLDRIEKIIDTYHSGSSLKHLVKPMRDKLDVEQFKLEQNYQGFDKVETDQLIKEINLQEPLDELLDMI